MLHEEIDWHSSAVPLIEHAFTVETSDTNVQIMASNQKGNSFI